MNHKVEIKESEMINKYVDLAREQQQKKKKRWTSG